MDARSMRLTQIRLGIVTEVEGMSGKVSTFNTTEAAISRSTGRAILPPVLPLDDLT